MYGQIIIVSGTSGSGKSTTCELFSRRSRHFWLLYGIDHFMSSTFPAKFGHHGPQCLEGIYAHPVDPNDPGGALRWSFGEQGTQGIHTMHAWVAAASREGCNVILDHLMMIDPPILQDCIWRMKGLPVLFISLKPPYEVLMERVASRKMDKKNPAAEFFAEDAVKRAVEMLNRLRPWFYEAVYANDCYDLEIDTLKHGPEEVCDLVEKRLAEGPGTAFARLRRRYPRPANRLPRSRKQGVQ